MKPIGIPALFVSFALSAGFAEAKGFKNRFAKLDTDHNGTISLAEFTAGKKHPDKAAKRFAKFDKNGDGQLDKEEFAALQEARKRHHAKKHTP